MAVTSPSFVKAGEIQLCYHDLGDGPPIVWLHGGGPGASGFSNFECVMPDFVGSYRNLLFDLPQYGLSDCPMIPERRATYNATAIVAAMDELGIQKAHFVGNSLGGATAVRAAINFPDRVDRLVLMGAAGIVTETVPEGIPLLLGYMIEEPSLERMRTLLSAMVYDQSLITEELVNSRFEAGSDPERLEIWRQSGPGLEEIKADLHKVRAPTLVIWGREDKFVTLESALEIHQRD